jgi:DNA (cytosine-5)-methyltransferase 1
MRLQRTPNPLDLNNKLNPKFVEYMMGLPEGWVTDLPISRSQQLKLLGNGVVPQQAFRALEILNTI